MSVVLNFGRDVQGFNAYAPAPSGDKWSVTATTGSATSITVPSNYQTWIAVFSYTPGSNIWVANNTTATVAPSAFAATTSDLNPSARKVSAGDVLSFITGDTTSPQVKVSFYVVAEFGN